MSRALTSRARTGAPWAAVGMVLLAGAVGCSSAPAATGNSVLSVDSTTATTTTVADAVTSTTVGTAPPRVPSPVVTGGAPAPTPVATAPTTSAPTGPQITAAPSGPRMLLVELSSHPNGGWCPLVGAFDILQFSFQAADTYLVLVKNAAGDVLASLPPNTTFTMPHLCAQMPVLYRFYPLAADGTFGPPWNFNV